MCDKNKNTDYEDYLDYERQYINDEGERMEIQAFYNVSTRKCPSCGQTTLYEIAEWSDGVLWDEFDECQSCGYESRDE